MRKRRLMEEEWLFTSKVFVAAVGLFIVGGALTAGALSCAWPKGYYLQNGELREAPYNWLIVGHAGSHPWHNERMVFDAGRFLHSTSGWVLIVGVILTITSLGVLTRGITEFLQNAIFGQFGRRIF